MIVNYKADRDLAWAHGLDDGQFSNYFGVSSIPTMVLIDADGFFRYFHVGLWTSASISTKVASIL